MAFCPTTYIRISRKIEERMLGVELCAEWSGYVGEQLVLDLLRVGRRPRRLVDCAHAQGCRPDLVL